MISITYILLVMFMHWVFDFLCQNSYMGNNKSHSIKALLTHTGLYSILWIFLYPILKMKVFTFILVTFVIHTVTDFITSKITHHYYDKKKYRTFFNVIGFDQWLHTV